MYREHRDTSTTVHAMYVDIRTEQLSEEAAALALSALAFYQSQI